MSVRRDLAFRPGHPTRPSSRNYPLNDNLTPGETPEAPHVLCAGCAADRSARGRRSLKRGSVWSSISRRAIALARCAALGSPSAAETIEPFIRMCQERANESGSLKLASSASWRTTDVLQVLDARSAGWMSSSELEQHVDERAGFEVIAVKPLVKQLASMLIGGTLSRRSRCRRSLASSSATSAIWSSPCTSAEELKNLR